MRKCLSLHHGSWLTPIFLLLMGVLILSLNGCFPRPEPGDIGETTPVPEDFPRLADCNRNGIFDIAEIMHRTLGFQDPLLYRAGSEPVSVAAGDFNNDGDLDLAIASKAGNTVSTLFNNGRGRFIPPMVGLFPVGVEPIRVVAHDLNGDELDDLAVAHYNNDIRILLNDSASPGTFSDAGSYAVGEASETWYLTDLAAQDLDDDGAPDLAVTAHRGGNYRLVVFWNGGDGTFEPPQHHQVVTNQPVSVTIADFDRDGDPDLAVSGNSGRIALVRNDGRRSFTTPERPADPDDPFEWRHDFLYTVGSGDIKSMFAMDLNGDRYPELVTANWGAEAAAIMLNRGEAGWGFEHTPLATLDVGVDPSDVVVADMDGDALPDLVLGASSGENFSVLLNKGDTAFEGYRHIAGGNSPVALIAHDLDGRGPADLAVINRLDGQLTVLLNDSRMGRDCNENSVPDDCDLGEGTSADCNANGVPDECDLTGSVDFSPREFGEGRFPIGYDPALTSFDLDADDDLDLITVNSWVDEPVHGWFNDGKAVFPWETRLVDRFERIDSEGIWVAPDQSSLSIANSTEGTVSIYYQSTVIGLEWVHEWLDGYTFDPGILYIWRGDLNNDGRSDLAVIPHSTLDNIAIYRNKGTRELPPDRRTRYYDDANRFEIPLADIPAGEPPTSMTAADLDSDGYPEILFTNFLEGTTSVCINESSPETISFRTPCLSFPSGETPRKVRVGDLDGDGLIDLAVANDYSRQVSILMNQSTGTDIEFASPLTVHVGPHRDAFPKDLAMADFDGDGDLDLATANWGTDNVSVLRNAGDGTFMTPLIFSAGFRPEAMLAADLDSDAKPDLAVANGNGKVTVLLNRSSGPRSEDANGNGVPDECE